MRLRRWPAPPWIALAVAVLLIVRRLLSPAPEPPENLFRETEVVVKRVVDGDTLLLESGHRVRLIGVDTPETKHPDRPAERLGHSAYRFTSELVGDGRVRLEFDRERRDAYRRLLAYVYLPDGRMLNEEIIRAGYSEAKTTFPYRNDRKRLFAAAEELARRDQVGLWATSPVQDDAEPRQPSQTRPRSRP